MKRISVSGLLLIAIMFYSALYSFAQDKQMPFSQMPEKVQSFVKKHFSQQTVVSSKLDVEVTGREYEVKLSDGTELEFDSKLNIKSIDSKVKLPDGVIPSKILLYTKKNYPNNYITDWERKTNYQKIELNSELELIFDKDGQFIRLD